MRVRDVMVRDVKFCSPKLNLAAVAEILWKQGCGTLPVVEDGRVLGMVTDRDICIALGTRNAKAAETLVKDVRRIPGASCELRRCGDGARVDTVV